MKLHLAAGAAAFALAASGAASAATLAGVPSNGVFAGNWANETDGQNFLVEFALAGPASVDGFDLYTTSFLGALGTNVTIRLRSDVGGNPDSVNLAEFTDTIDTRTDTGNFEVLVGAHFAGIQLAAGNYWIGMSGPPRALGWNSYDYGDPSPVTQRVLTGETVASTPPIHSLGFVVEGNAIAAPEPAAWAMVLLGFCGLGGALRARRAAAAA